MIKLDLDEPNMLSLESMRLLSWNFPSCVALEIKKVYFTELDNKSLKKNLVDYLLELFHVGQARQRFCQVYKQLALT